MKIHYIVAVASCALAICAVIGACMKNEVVDEAKATGKTAADFPADVNDYFHDADMRPDGTLDAAGKSV